MAENEGAAVAVDNAAVPTNEWERMLSGELYICGDMQREANMRKRRLVHAINTSAYDAFEERDRLFRELFGSLGKGAFLEPPFNCDLRLQHVYRRQLLCQYGLHLPRRGENHHRRPCLLRPARRPVHAIPSNRCGRTRFRSGRRPCDHHRQ